MPTIDLGQVVGPQGPQGATGPTGATGPAGPNSISGSTATTLTGILKGDGSTVGTATVDSAPNNANTDHLISSAGAAKQIIKVNFGTLTGTGGTVTVTKRTIAARIVMSMGGLD